MKNTQETTKASVLIFTNYVDIKDNQPTIRKFDFLSSAHLYAEMINSSYSFPLIQVLDHNGQLYCEFEA